MPPRIRPERKGCLWAPQPNASARHIAIMLPFAGGSSAVFRTWPNLLRAPAGSTAACEMWAVEYPGRGARFGESFPNTIEELAQSIAKDIIDHIPPSRCDTLTLYGHSLGGLVTFALARVLSTGITADASAARYRYRQLRVVIGACRAPHSAPNPHGLASRCAKMTDTQFLDGVKAMGGTPPEFFENKELVDMYLPVLRSDFLLAGQVLSVNTAPDAPVSQSPLSPEVPITVVLGRGDELSQAHGELWSQCTRGTCQVHMIEGGHFFLNEDLGRASVTDIINAVIAAPVPVSPVP